MTTLSSKLRTAAAACALVVASLATAPSMHAQRALVQANVPFDFQYGSSHMQAGKYRVNMESGQILELEGRPHSSLSMVQWDGNGHASSTGKLVFRKYGDTYLLKEIWIPGQAEHARIPKTRSEKVLEELSQNTRSAPSNIEVALVESPR